MGIVMKLISFIDDDKSQFGGLKPLIRKVIGIMPLYDDEKESYWMLPGYMKMLEAENAI